MLKNLSYLAVNNVYRKEIKQKLSLLVVKHLLYISKSHNYSKINCT